MYLVWLAILVFEIIFIFWHIQYKKQKSSKIEDKEVIEKKESFPQPTTTIVENPKTTIYHILEWITLIGQ